MTAARTKEYELMKELEGCSYKVYTCPAGFGCIYKITNVVNGKVYVGQTTKSPVTRWRQHVRDARRGSAGLLHRALMKYPAEMFTWEVIVNNVPVDLLDDLEVNCIAMEDSFIQGYNLCEGGKGSRGWKPNKDQYAKIVAHLRDNNPFKGKHHTDLTKNALSTKATIRNMEHGNSFAGCKHTEESKSIMSEKAKGRHSGSKHPLYGIGHSEASKEKMRKSSTKYKEVYEWYNLDSKEIVSGTCATMARVVGNKSGAFVRVVKNPAHRSCKGWVILDKYKGRNND